MSDRAVTVTRWSEVLARMPMADHVLAQSLRVAVERVLTEPYAFLVGDQRELAWVLEAAKRLEAINKGSIDEQRRDEDVPAEAQQGRP